MCPVHHPGKENRRNNERIRLTTFKLPVFLWDEESQSDALKGFSFVSDISATGAGFYLKENLPKGTLVRLALESRESKSYRGIVMWSNRFDLRQRFYASETFSYRIGIRFRFSSEAERQRYLKYLEELQGKALLVKPGMSF